MRVLGPLWSLFPAIPFILPLTLHPRFGSNLTSQNLNGHRCNESSLCVSLSPVITFIHPVTGHTQFGAYLTVENATYKNLLSLVSPFSGDEVHSSILWPDIHFLDLIGPPRRMQPARSSCLVLQAIRYIHPYCDRTSTNGIKYLTGKKCNRARI
jgi:hypothetical protein